MKFGKRGDSDDAGTAGASAGDSSAAPQPLPPVPGSPPTDPPAEHEAPGAPAGEELPVFQAEPVVEGEAYEVFADEPISVVTAGAGPAPVTTLGDSGEAFASGHAAAPGPSWQEPVMELADERPELVVAAAFAGGLLAAMILRRLAS